MGASSAIMQRETEEIRKKVVVPVAHMGVYRWCGKCDDQIQCAVCNSPVLRVTPLESDDSYKNKRGNYSRAVAIL